MKEREQDGYNVKVDAKYGNYIKLGIAALTAFGLLGTGAHQAGFIDVFPDDEVKCGQPLHCTRLVFFLSFCYSLIIVVVVRCFFVYFFKFINMENALVNIHSIFPRTRETLKSYGSDGSTFAKLAISLINHELTPFILFYFILIVHFVSPFPILIASFR
jgi:hypothetical protein